MKKLVQNNSNKVFNEIFQSIKDKHEDSDKQWKVVG